MRKLIIVVLGPLFLMLAVFGYGIGFYKENFVFGLLVSDIAFIGGVRSYNILLRQEFKAPSLSHKLALGACIIPVAINTALLILVIYNLLR
ncbi:hypothetical protein AAKU58_004371 [Oxalobacteraceae bacterium GrIS 1.18]